MRMLGVVFVAPILSRNSRFKDRSKTIGHQQLVSNARVERLDESVLSRLSRLNEEQLDVVIMQPKLSRAEAINSGPLSTRRQRGYPCSRAASSSVQTTDALGYENSGCTASAYRLHSSSSVRARKTRPCSSRSETKSMVQISLGRSERRKGTPRTYLARLRRRRFEICRFPRR